MDAAAMHAINSCNYFCARPDCIKAQRDEMRDALFDQQTVAALQQKLAELERGEYICHRCSLRKDGETSPADF